MAHDSSHPMPSRCIITVNCYKQIVMCVEVKLGIAGIPGMVLYTHDISPPIGPAILLQVTKMFGKMAQDVGMV